MVLAQLTFFLENSHSGPPGGDNRTVVGGRSPEINMSEINTYEVAAFHYDAPDLHEI